MLTTRVPEITYLRRGQSGKRKAPKTKTIKYKGVYRIHQRATDPPAYKIAASTADQWVRLGYAVSMNRGKGVRLTIKADKLRDQSCSMGMGVMDSAVVFGSDVAMATVNEWERNHRGDIGNGKGVGWVEQEGTRVGKAGALVSMIVERGAEAGHDTGNIHHQP